MTRRPLAALAALAGLPVLLVLTLSDRAPRLSWQALMDLRLLGARVEGRLGLQPADVEVPISPDVAVHLALWAAAGFVAVRLLRGHVPLAVVAAALVGASLALEVAQVVLTSTRDLQVKDALANGIGVAVGVAAAWVYARVEPVVARHVLRPPS